MDSDKILDVLDENGLSDLEIVNEQDNYIVIKFSYDFDDEEKKGAKSYANEESDLEEDSSEWLSDWYLSYLYDVAKDNIQEIVEEICEDFELEGEYRTIEDENTEFMRTVLVLCQDSSEIDMEEILSEIN